MYISRKDTYVPSLSGLPSHPAHLGHHRAPSGIPGATQWVPTRYLFPTWQCITVSATLSLCPTLCLPVLSMPGPYIGTSAMFSHSVVSHSLWPRGPQHARPPCPSPSPGACSNSCPLMVHPTISSSVGPFSSCSQSFPASGSFPMSWLFTSGGQSIPALQIGSSVPFFHIPYIYICINIQYLFISFWLISLSVTDSRSIHITTIDLIHSISWPSDIPLYIHIYMYIHTHHISFIHSSADGLLGCFHVLDTVNSAAVDTRVPVSFWIMVFSGCMSSSGIAGSYGSFIPSFLGNLHTVLHSGCISLHPRQQCNSSPPFFFPQKLIYLFCVSSCWKLGPVKAPTHKTHSWIKCGIH